MTDKELIKRKFKEQLIDDHRHVMEMIDQAVEGFDGQLYKIALDNTAVNETLYSIYSRLAAMHGCPLGQDAFTGPISPCIN